MTQHCYPAVFFQILVRLSLKLTLYETDLEDFSPAATVFTVAVQYLFFYSMWLT